MSLGRVFEFEIMMTNQGFLFEIIDVKSGFLQRAGYLLLALMCIVHFIFIFLVSFNSH